jgi:ComB9 competence protein
MPTKFLSTTAVFCLALPIAAFAQTAATPTPPVPDSVLQQAEEHEAGMYGHLVRPRSSGQVQEAWDDSTPGAAIYTTDLCTDCTYKVRLREWMVSVIELPRGEEIKNIDLGDDKSFQVSRRGKRRIAVRPIGHGYDSNLLVYGSSGAVYPFYLRAEGFNSGSTPDLMVRINGAVNGEMVTPDFAVEVSADKERDVPLPAMPLEHIRNPLASPSEIEDFAQTIAFNPDTLHGWGDYELHGNDDSLRPETVFRDEHFTYIRFGKNWNRGEKPAVFSVHDGIDELVNLRVSGTTFIVEAVSERLTLKFGESFLCVVYTGEEA